MTKLDELRGKLKNAKVKLDCLERDAYLLTRTITMTRHEVEDIILDYDVYREDGEL